MLGFKIIKETEYDALLAQIEDLKTEITSKVREINFCEGQINDLIDQNKDLQNEIDNFKNRVQLLTDVAEAPLQVTEEKTEKKRTKKVKNTSDTTAKPRKVVRKKKSE